ncbi:hypothetical protein [Klebsiella pneumoniae IS53]|nr:hypothetical protein [Klebsiella pneumoniae IS53]
MAEAFTGFEPQGYDRLYDNIFIIMNAIEIPSIVKSTRS